MTRMIFILMNGQAMAQQPTAVCHTVPCYTILYANNRRRRRRRRRCLDVAPAERGGMTPSVLGSLSALSIDEKEGRNPSQSNNNINKEPRRRNMNIDGFFSPFFGSIHFHVDRRRKDVVAVAVVGRSSSSSSSSSASKGGDVADSTRDVPKQSDESVRTASSSSSSWSWLCLWILRKEGRKSTINHSEILFVAGEQREEAWEKGCFF
eukprot:scaffold5783_cov129-Amphora_coffeaeformis.AAC.20